jgi:FkbM family methyltransferase
MSRVKRLVQGLVTGTRWEAPVKRVHHAVTGSRSSLYDAQTIEIMRRVLRPDSAAIDAGAFVGGMLRHMLRFAPRGRHWAFEPLPDLHRSLAARFPGVSVLPFALGAAPGRAEYVRVSRFPALSGLKRRPDVPPESATETLVVQVETLDRVIPADQQIALIKVDVEGGELDLFRGAAATLARSRPVVVFECGLAARAYGATPEAIHDSLTAPGLEVSTLEDWLAGRPGFSRDRFAEYFHEGREFYFIAHP